MACVWIGSRRTPVFDVDPLAVRDEGEVEVREELAILEYAPPDVGHRV